LVQKVQQVLRVRGHQLYQVLLIHQLVRQDHEVQGILQVLFLRFLHLDQQVQQDLWVHAVQVVQLVH